MHPVQSLRTDRVKDHQGTRESQSHGTHRLFQGYYHGAHRVELGTEH